MSRVRFRRTSTSVVALAAAVILAAALDVSAVAVRRVVDPDPSTVVVEVAGSSDFFDDSAVVSELQKDGYRIDQSDLGSYQIANEPDPAAGNALANADGKSAALYIESKVPKQGNFPETGNPYSSPLVIVTHPQIVSLLVTAGIVKYTNGIPIFDVATYLNAVTSGEEWADIKGNKTFLSPNRIMLTTTDPMYSNSGATFAAILADTLNAGTLGRGQPLSDPDFQSLDECFTIQGAMEQHTPDLLRKFAADGMNAYPMALVYESSAISAKFGRSGTLPADTVLMYPNPDIVSDTTLVAFNALGEHIINLLSAGTPSSDPSLVGLEEQDGFRTSSDSQTFMGYMASRHVPVINLDQAPVTFVRPPDESAYQALIKRIG